MIIKAFHGTNKQNSDNIINNNFRDKKFVHDLKARNDLPGDLGTGIYAFKDNKELALDFASKFYPKKDCAVIELHIDVQDKDILDFDEENNLDQFLNAKKRFLKLASQYFNNCKGKRYCIDGIIIELMLNFSKVNPKIILKRTHTPLSNEYIDNGRGKIPLTSNYYNGTEVCIRDKAVIMSRETC